MRRTNVNKIAINIIVLAFALSAYAQPNMSAEAEAFFAKGEYLKGMNILTKAMNAPDPAERSQAMQAYGRFYENTVGNVDYALTFYSDILRLNLPENDAVKSAANKDVSRIKLLKVQYRTED